MGGFLADIAGVSIESVTERMVAEGMDRAAATDVCQELLASPAYAAGDWMSQRLKKLESTLDVLRAVRCAGGPPRSVERRAGLGRDDFLQKYYAVNAPVLLADVAEGGLRSRSGTRTILLRSWARR